MKSFIILALIFTAVNSSFLRDLTVTAVTVSAVEFNALCTVDTEVTITATTGQTDGFTEDAAFKGVLSSGVVANDITIGDGAQAEGDANKNKLVWEFTPGTTNKTGVYKLKSITHDDDEAGYTFTIADTIIANVTISTAATHNATQEGTQEIEEGKAFEVMFDPAPAKVPFIYTSNTATTPIADCSIDTTETKKVLCKPTKDEMEKDTEYTIHYKNGCETALVATKVKVKFTAEDSSAFMTLGKVALFALALLF